MADPLWLFAFHPGTSVEDLSDIETVDKLPKIEAIRQLTEVEGRTWELAAEHFREFEESRMAIAMVLRNHDEFTAMLRSFEKACTDGSIRGTDQNRMRFEINKLVTSLLTSFRSYLDHTRTRLDRRYGKASSVLAAFVNAHGVAKGHFAFRFIECLRNHAQHVGLPVGQVAAPGRIEGDPLTASAVYRVEVTFDTEELQRIGGKRSWALVAKDLTSMPRMLNVAPLVAESIGYLQTLDAAVIRSEIPALTAAAEAAERILGDAEVLGAEGGVGRWEDHGDGQATLTLIQISDRMIAAFGLKAFQAQAQG